MLNVCLGPNVWSNGLVICGSKWSKKSKPKQMNFSDPTNSYTSTLKESFTGAVGWFDFV